MLNELPDELSRLFESPKDLLRYACKRDGIFSRWLSYQEYEPKENYPHVHLFRCVLDRALKDYVTDPDEEMSDEINEWLARDTEDFNEVCKLADLNADVVHFIFTETKRILEEYLNG